VWLHGTVTALLLAQRGEFALHASVVDVDGLGVAVAGRRGAGKSTTALRLAQRGHPLVTDDVSPLQNEGRFSVHPFGRPIHVAPETARGIGLDVSAAPPVTGDDSKLTLPPPASAPVPLRAIAVLRAGSGLAVEAVRTRGLRAHRLVRLHTYRGPMLQQLFHTELFTWAGEVAAEVPVYVVTRPAQGWTVDAVADVLERIAAVTAEDGAAPVRPARSRTGP
jgi:hypothetical protein